jgi:predicted GIY-YIG superfamily endonuclease
MKNGVTNGMSEYINTMHNKPNVYIIRDPINKKSYIGVSNGKYKDYFCSSQNKEFKQIIAERKDTLKRKIVFEFDTYEEALEAEYQLQDRRSKRGTWSNYYNIIVGDPMGTVRLSGESNPNYKDGMLVGQYDDPTIRKRVDKIRNAERHSEHKVGNRHRMLARYYLDKDETKAKEHFDAWQDYKRSMPPSTKGNYIRKYESWNDWKNKQSINT